MKAATLFQAVCRLVHGRHKHKLTHSLQQKLRSQRGQMSVELVAVIPVVLIVAAIGMNILDYMGQCAKFDRIASEAVRVYGVSPGYGQYGASNCNGAIERAIRQAFDTDAVDVEVSSQDINVFTGADTSNSNLLFALIPSYRRYTCTMSFSPRFFGTSIFGVLIPQTQHTTEYVIDPYEPGGWM